ncbi:MAG TPA: biotin--[acetyl-CoA-carboxylase] ligase [Solirubrobacteraceae bacterium]|nr:biotin--[acetyl-CoA-carboxylase] ligase [Solirubrobacteraceae bacterium]
MSAGPLGRPARVSAGPLGRSAPVNAGPLGRPRLHLRRTDSTNERARLLAGAGAPHGTLVTASEQTAGRGRQGRRWSAPPGRALLMSLVLRQPPALLPLAAAVAVAQAAEESLGAADPGPPAGRVAIKWPNDVLLGGRKLAGILVEARPQEGWAVLGIGLNAAVAAEDLPPELRPTAIGLGLEPADVEMVLGRVLKRLAGTLEATEQHVLEAWRARDALLGAPVRWAGGEGVGAGIDGDGRLVVALSAGGQTVLDAGEVHLGSSPEQPLES